MSDSGAQDPAADHQYLPAAIKVEREAEVWRDVLDFKVHQQLAAGDQDAGSGGKRSSSWEIVDCSHASECGSPARTLPGSEFGVLEHAGGQADVAPDFHEAHARALVELEALEAAGEEGLALGSAPRGSTPLPVSTDDGQLKAPQPAQVLSVSSDSSCDTPLASGHLGKHPVECLKAKEVLEVQSLTDESNPAIEVGVDGDGYSSAEEVQGLGTRHTKSEPDSHEAMVDLQEMSQEGSLDGSYWPECVGVQATEELEVAVGKSMRGVDSFVDVGAAEGAFSEMSFESPKGAQSGGEQTLVPDESLGMEEVGSHAKAGPQEEGKVAPQVDAKSLKGAAEVAGGLFWLSPKMHRIVQRCTALAMGLLPNGTGPQLLSMVELTVSRVDWKGVAYGASLAMLSAVIVGLLVQNRRLNNEVRKKQEEVTRLMKAVMNFQELWSSHRSGKMPILRHTNFTNFPPSHHPF
ncbi:unnamed protein product [Ostreobium quekettii]|uniref:Uncharacterized protein n=1 Tax=Ostreobium quekettii TaxID=121088 RepID=A0A8S1J4C5_9CHLO|nr:unnamed protein product [Ostreobium quekettii]|eukprot:evm.model.scf_305.6 EVM.evm.TU.scf_305.6   scf_305:28458-32568(+)